MPRVKLIISALLASIAMQPYLQVSSALSIYTQEQDRRVALFIPPTHHPLPFVANLSLPPLPVIHLAASSLWHHIASS